MRRTGLFISLFIALVFGSGCSLINLAESDQAALDSLREAGSDFSKVHPFDFYLYHPEKSGADQLCTQLGAQGFQVMVREGAIEGEWLCLATLNFPPSIEKLSELQDLFDQLVSQFGGEYDGWETVVVP